MFRPSWFPCRCVVATASTSITQYLESEEVALSVVRVHRAPLPVFKEYQGRSSSRSQDVNIPCALRSSIGSKEYPSCASCSTLQIWRAIQRFAQAVSLQSPLRLPLPHSQFWFSSLFSFLVAGSATEFQGSKERTKDRVLSVFTGVQQQCVTRGHCSAATAKSGIV